MRRIAVTPALGVIPLGISSIAIRTRMRWTSLTQLKVGLTLAISSLQVHLVQGSLPARSSWDTGTGHRTRPRGPLMSFTMICRSSAAAGGSMRPRREIT